ncbi:MAG: aromatic amino acid transport family protein [Patescibacteria group bacterium]
MMRFLLSVATLVGTIVGVGMFGLPAVTAEAGWLSIAVIALIVLPLVVITHLAYAHVVVLTSSRARLPGYAGLWLGKPAKYVAFVSQALGLVGSSLAYLMVGGSFLAQFISSVLPIPFWAGVAIFFLAGAVLVWRGTKSIARAELVMVGIMLCAIVVLGIAALPSFRSANLAAIPFTGAPWRAYGVLIFSLWGMSVIPEVAEVSSRRNLGEVVAGGVILSFLASALFVLIALGVSDGAISADALSSLSMHLGKGVRLFGFGFGVLATFTSYLTLTRVTVDMLRYDFRIGTVVSFISATVIPLILLLMGFNDFITVLAITGAVSLGIEGILVMMIEEHAVRERPQQKIFHMPSFVRNTVILLLCIGISLELLATIGVLK